MKRRRWEALVASLLMVFSRLGGERVPMESPAVPVEQWRSMHCMCANSFQLDGIRHRSTRKMVYELNHSTRFCIDSRVMALRGGGSKSDWNESWAVSRVPLASPARDGESFAKKDADALVSYARLVGMTRGASSSEKALLRALELNPHNTDAAAAYARLLHKDGCVTDAVHMYRRALFGCEAPSAHTDQTPCDAKAGGRRIDDNVGAAVDRLIEQPGHLAAKSADTFAGFAGLLLSHPTLALKALPSAGTHLLGSNGSTSEVQPCSIGTARENLGRRRTSAGCSLDDQLALSAGRRLLLHAIALAPSSSACADGMRDLVLSTLEHYDDDGAALFAHNSSAGQSRAADRHADEADMLQQCMRLQELRARALVEQHASATLHLEQLIKQQSTGMHSSRRAHHVAAAAARKLSSTAHTPPISDLKCTNIEATTWPANTLGARAPISGSASACARTRFFAAAAAMLDPAHTALPAAASAARAAASEAEVAAATRATGATAKVVLAAAAAAAAAASIIAVSRNSSAQQLAFTSALTATGAADAGHAAPVKATSI